MAKFSIELDRRVPLKNGRYNLSVRMCKGNDVMFLKIVPVTEDQYHSVFTRNDMSPRSAEFRKKCTEFKTKCETTLAGMNPFNKEEYRRLVYDKEKKIEEKDSLRLKVLVERFLSWDSVMKLHTKDQYKTAINKFDSFKPGISITDITPSLLMKFERKLLDDDLSQFTIATYMRHLRSLINHFIYTDKVVPSNFRYPFGKRGGYIIKKSVNQKIVMPAEDIRKVVELQDFKSEEEEYARDLWVLSYWCNGVNYADLFRLKRTSIDGDLIRITRMKTESTLRNNVRDILVSLFPNLKKLIEKLDVKTSPYVLGHPVKGCDEITFRSKKDWQLQKIRRGLKSLNERLNLSVPLKYKTARDCYSSTLQRAGYSDDIIDELGHAPVHLMTAHYKGLIDKEVLFERNRCLIGIG
jgi:hypothetical protein